MQRRNFLGGLTAASLGLLLEASLAEGAHAQNTAQGVQMWPVKLPLRRLKSRFQETRYSCAATERGRPF